MSNVYYSPEDFGLVIVAEIDSGGSYEFDQVVVWRDRAGDLWGAHDCGCSCPTPFEYIKYPEGMTPIKAPEDVRPLLDGMSAYSLDNLSSVLLFADKVREALR